MNDFTLEDFSKLTDVLFDLPKEVSWEINYKGKTYLDIDDLIYDAQQEFFDTKLEDYKKMVGKCFIDNDKTTVLKVVGLPEGKNEYPYFLYEEYHCDRSGNWHHKSYNWLQNSVHGEYPNKKNEKYCLTPETEMNVAAEEMYNLGIDGNLYVDYSCGGDYIVYKPCKESLFKYAKEDAIDNDGEYNVRDYD